MADQRHRNSDWNANKKDGSSWPLDVSAKMHTALLMDIRDELQKLNAVIACPNTAAIPQLLRDVVRNTGFTREMTARIGVDIQAVRENTTPKVRKRKRAAKKKVQ